jgi:transcriptional regulator with XRE-family HTH domain
MGMRFEFGGFLKQIRESQLISQDMLAENSGLLRHQIIAIEKGKSNYTIDNLFRYLHGLKVSSINLEAQGEIFDFDIDGYDMTLETIREKVTEKVIFDETWLYKLDDSSPGHYGVNDHEVELSSEDVFVNIPQRSFQFKNANFHFDLNLMSSKDGNPHKGMKVADGNGTFRFSQDGKNIELEILNIDVDLDLFSE